jgi:hypothetical protein
LHFWPAPSPERDFCSKCASALWLFDPHWPELVHPFASAIDTPLPVPPSRVHLMLKYKASWVVPAIGRRDQAFQEYPELSIEDWHRQHGLRDCLRQIIDIDVDQQVHEVSNQVFVMLCRATLSMGRKAFLMRRA